jgi:aspartate/methionine/tyrosine aminotransferase
MTSLLPGFAPAARIAELRARSRRPALAPAPPGAVSLAMGEPDFPTPRPVVEAAVDALRERPSERVARELSERGVMVRAGAEYGPSGEGHVRISFAASEDDLRAGLARIVRYAEDQQD